MKISIILYIIFLPACLMLLFLTIKKDKNKKNKRMSDENFIVMLPNVILMLGAICALMSALIMLGFTFLSNEQIHIIFYLSFGLFFWIGIYLIIKTITFKVIVKGEEITVLTAFKRPYTFTFKDIVSVKRQVKNNKVKSERLVIKTSDGKKLIVENIEISYEKFANKIRSEIRGEYLTGF